MQMFKRIARAALVLCTMALGIGVANAAPVAPPAQIEQPQMLDVGGGGPDHWDRYRDNLERRDHHRYSRSYSRRSRCYTEWQTVWTYYGPRIEPVRVCEGRRRGRGR